MEHKNGISSLSLLTIVFITLKLTNYISWSWWWVTAPLWGGVLVTVAAFLCIVSYLYVTGE